MTFFDLTQVHESSSVCACQESRASPLDWRRPFFDATTSRGAMHDLGNVVHNPRKIVENRQNRPESPAGPCSALNLNRQTRLVAPRVRPRPNYNVRPFTWSRNFFHPTTSRGAVPGLREILKCSEMLRDNPKCDEFHLDFSFFDHQFSQQFVRRKFGPRKHNTVQNVFLYRA